jgi:transcriptional regulator with XRE-family HTH domain
MNLNYWAIGSTRPEVAMDIEILEGSALASAQSTIQNAINDSGISRSDLARRMGRNRSFVSRMLSGSHNLTIKTMARSLASCGYEVRFQTVPIVWDWVTPPVPVEIEEEVPANAGTTMWLPTRIHSSVHARWNEEN